MNIKRYIFFLHKNVEQKETTKDNSRKEVKM